MLTEKDYCDYDICIALKKFGLKWDCDENDMLECKAARPSLYIAQKFLREEKKLIVLVGFDFCPFTSEIVYYWVIVVNGNTAKNSSYTYDYFEEALSEGIKEAIKILKEYEADKVL